ncbi:hypothetical protein U0070_020576, partial [Myodes glareolus]
GLYAGGVKEAPVKLLGSCTPGSLDLSSATTEELLPIIHHRQDLERLGLDRGHARDAEPGSGESIHGQGWVAHPPIPDSMDQHFPATSFSGSCWDFPLKDRFLAGTSQERAPWYSGSV